MSVMSFLQSKPYFTLAKTKNEMQICNSVNQKDDIGNQYIYKMGMVYRSLNGMCKNVFQGSATFLTDAQCLVPPIHHSEIIKKDNLCV